MAKGWKQILFKGLFGAIQKSIGMKLKEEWNDD
jgi:hypothetical protein